MWAIWEAEVVERFANERSIVSVFVGTGYDKTAINWLQDSISQFNMDAGARWHLLFPVEQQNPDLVLLSDRHSFSEEVAARLASRYGIPSKQLPAIVFDDFDDQRKQLYISLRGCTPEELRTLVEEALAVIGEGTGDGANESPLTYRREIIGRIYDRIQAKAAAKGLIAWLPKVGSMFKAAASGAP